jgi:hypothetical protein
MLRHFEQVPDPWACRGHRHLMAYVLALAACAVPAGARSLTAIAEWAADLPRDRSPAPVHAPSIPNHTTPAYHPPKPPSAASSNAWTATPSMPRSAPTCANTPSSGRRRTGRRT